MNSIATSDNQPTILLHPSGTVFRPFDPQPRDIHIEDIAHALACTNRFGGHLPEPYSVAQHCLVVSELCEEDPLGALLHEVAEALSGLGDVQGPVKRHPALHHVVKDLELRIELAAAERFDLDPGFASSPSVKRADRIAFVWEDRDLRGSRADEDWAIALRSSVPTRRIEPMSWRDARGWFLTRFMQLTRERRA